MMRYYRISLRGVRPLIMHNSMAGLDKRSPANQEKSELTKKQGRNRTQRDEERLQELECQTSLWLDLTGQPTVPAAALRACLETARPETEGRAAGPGRRGRRGRRTFCL